MNDMKGTTFADAVAAERQRQNDKWGVQRHTWGNWLLILGEEFGEVCQAMLAVEFPQAPDQADRSATALEDARMELVQVAAVCAQLVDVLDELMERSEAAEVAP